MLDAKRITTYAGVYEHFGLLHERSYFAHCIHCCGEERALLKDKKVFGKQWPRSTINTPEYYINIDESIN